MQARKHASTQARKHASTQARRHASTHALQQKQCMHRALCSVAREGELHPHEKEHRISCVPEVFLAVTGILVQME
eukprot:7393131-Alexandrium_andersonii.AAC.1